MTVFRASLNQRLSMLASEIRAGNRPDDRMSIQSIDSLSNDDRIAWRQLRKVFESIGISVADLAKHQQYIISLLQKAIDDDILESSDGVDNTSRSFPVQSQNVDGGLPSSALAEFSFGFSQPPSPVTNASSQAEVDTLGPLKEINSSNIEPAIMQPDDSLPSPPTTQTFHSPLNATASIAVSSPSPTIFRGSIPEYKLVVMGGGGVDKSALCVQVSSF